MGACDSYFQIKPNLPIMVKISRINNLGIRFIRVSMEMEQVTPLRRTLASSP